MLLRRAAARPPKLSESRFLTYWLHCNHELNAMIISLLAISIIINMQAQECIVAKDTGNRI